MSGVERCPHCKASLQGDPIPQEFIDKGYYASGTTHYGRKMGHEIQGVYDGVLYWSCPDCGKAWARDFGNWDRLNTRSAEWVERHNAQVGAA